MWSVADTRCLISGHIVADFTHKGTAYRMCHRCGKVKEVPAADAATLAAAETRDGRQASRGLRPERLST